MVKVSVIIPVYNTEKYLSECLDSIVNQTFKDLEIICINDGSTDGSLKILNEYENRDNRIKVLSQENQGLAATRNAGLDVSNGNYIYFMDSDDILELDSIETLYDISEDKKLDMVLFKLINFDDETNEKYVSDYYEMSFLDKIVGDNVFTYKDVKSNLFNLAVSTPGKFFNRNLISAMRFPVGLIFEDNPFFFEAMLKAKRVYFYNKHLYIRRRRKDSITTNNDLSFADTIPISNLIMEILKKYDCYDELKDFLFNKKISISYYRFSLVVEEFKQEFFDRIQKDFFNFKNEVETSINLTSSNEYIFQKFLECKTYREFELSMELNKAKNNIKKLNKTIRKNRANEFARVNIKNSGIESNSIEIIANSDDNSTVKYPKRFKNKKGRGLAIESYSGELNLKIKAINDGKLKLTLKGINLKDNNNQRIKNLIDYTCLKINGETCLKGHNLHGHDEPYIYKKKVKDSEIVDIHIEWVTYDKMNEYVDEIKNKDEVLKQKESEIQSRGLSNKLKNKKIWRK